MQASRKPGIGLQPLKDIGAWMAGKYKTLPALPTVWRLKETYVALDRSSRSALAAGFDQAGGQISLPPVSRLRHDIDARIAVLAGDPRGDNFRPQIKFQDWKDVAHGTF